MGLCGLRVAQRDDRQEASRQHRDFHGFQPSHAEALLPPPPLPGAAGEFGGIE